MKRNSFIILAVILLTIFTSCKDVTGMWIDEFPEDYSGEEVWLTLDEEGAFEYITLSAPFTINMFYTGTYTVDSKSKTITLTADLETDGTRLDPGSEYDWADSSWTADVPYEFSGSDMIITIDSEEITLTEREQPIVLMRSISEENLKTIN